MQKLRGVVSDSVKNIILDTTPPFGRKTLRVAQGDRREKVATA